MRFHQTLETNFFSQSRLRKEQDLFATHVAVVHNGVL